VTALEHALEYLRRGWSPVPLARGTKGPPAGFTLAPYLAGKSRLTEAEAAVWWAEGSEYGVGIVTGRPSGLVVIDVDPRNGGDIRAVRERLGDGPLHVVQSGGGGWHIYCRLPDGLACPKGKTDMPGVDRLGDRGIVVAPPSVHPSGDPYYVLEDGPLIVMPPWLFSSAASVLSNSPAPGEPSGPSSPPAGSQSETEASSREPWIASVLADPASILPGSQHDTLCRLAWWAAGSLEEDIGQALVQSVADRLPLSDPSRPWTSRDVEGLVQSAYDRRKPEGKVLGLVADGDGPQERVPLFELDVDPATFGSSVDDDTAWLVPGLIAEASQTQVVGTPKAGKSTLLGTLVRSLAFGEPFLGKDVPEASVLWVSEQDGLSLKETLARAGLMADDQRLERVRIIRRGLLIGRRWSDVVRDLTEIVRRRRVRVVLIDTLFGLAGVRGEDENKAGIIHDVLAPFDAILALGAAVVYGRHSNRQADTSKSTDPFLSGRGSSAVDGAVDSGILVRKETEGTRLIYWAGRFGEEGRMRIEYRDGLYVPSENQEARPPQSVDRTMDEVLTAVPFVGAISQRAIEEATGISQSTVHRRLARLVSEGSVERVVDGYRRRPEAGSVEGLEG